MRPSRERGTLRAGVLTTLAVAAVAAPAGAVPMERDGDLLAFDSTRSGNGDILLVGRNGGAAPVLDATPWPSVEARPSWEPTRTGSECLDPPQPESVRIAFQSDHGTSGDLDIQTVAPDIINNAGLSHEPVDVTADPTGDETAPAWSPVFGSRSVIAYERRPAGQPSAGRDIWIVDPATGRRVDFTNDPGADEANPEWSPIFDRSFLAYDSDRGGTRQVWVQEYALPSGDDLPQPLGEPIQVTRGPAPASDPTWVAYTANDLEDPVQLEHDVVVRTDTLGTSFLDDLLHRFASFDPNNLPLPFDGSDGTVYPVTGDPGGDENPAWSPLGDALAYDSARGGPAGTGHVVLVLRGRSEEGADPGQPLTPTGGVYAPSPGADDRHPAWQSQHNCVDAIPHLPVPAPVSRTPHGGGGGGGGGGSGGGGGGGGAGGGSGSGGGGSGGGGDGGDGGTQGQGSTTVRLEIRRLSVRTTGHGARRRVRITLTLSRAAKARVKLLHGRRAVLNRVFALHAGSNALALRVPRSARAGQYRLTIKAVGGTTVRVDRGLRLPG